MNHFSAQKNYPCSVGDTMFYPRRVGDQIVVGDDAQVTQINNVGDGFCFQFLDELNADYEIHHFLSWASVGTLAFFSREAAESYIAALPPCEPFSDSQCDGCFTGTYQECKDCLHINRGDSTC